jgi:hypothetical protein
MVYKIKKIQLEKAKLINVTIKSSTSKGKKIDVFDKDGNKLASIGAIGYKDFATYLETDGLTVANERRKLYMARHSKEPAKKDGKFTPSYYAKKILW